MRKEIGSEFWNCHSAGVQMEIWKCREGDWRYYLSGRTALYSIIEDILLNRPARRAYLPSYCCHTMVIPFTRLGIQVDFYPVVPTPVGIVCRIDPEHRCDIILTMDYFGFAGQRAALPDAIHIHDTTHSMLSFPAYPNTDYIYGSMRKWGAVAGAAYACKCGGIFQTPPPSTQNLPYLALRNAGYQKKSAYMAGVPIKKSAFLTDFSSAEALLGSDFIGYCANEASLREAALLHLHRQRRRQNAALLLDALRAHSLLRPAFPILQENDVPLFVPLLVQDGLRDRLKQHLIAQDIYPPVHWPIHSGISDEGALLYRQELSLPCDQRYDEGDMERILNAIQHFTKRI